MSPMERERNRIFNEIDMVVRVANQMRLVLARNVLDQGDTMSAEAALERQKRELKKLTGLLRQMDACLNSSA